MPTSSISVEAKLQANRTAATWLQERLQQLGEQSVAAERAVLEFKQQNNIVAADGKLMDEQQLTDLNGRLVAARAQTSDLLARLNRIETIIRTGTSNPTFEATVSDVLTSPILTNLRQQYLELTRRESEWSSSVWSKPSCCGQPAQPHTRYSHVHTRRTATNR